MPRARMIKPEFLTDSKTGTLTAVANDSAPGANAEDENLMPAWAKAEKSESEVEKPAPDVFQSSEEPQRGLEPLRIGLIEDRFG